jgi:hypothetical protein
MCGRMALRAAIGMFMVMLFLSLPQATRACVPTPTLDPRTPTPTSRPTDTPEEVARKQADEVHQAFASADIVFRGQTTQTEKFVSGTMFGTNGYSLRATLTVDTIWKGGVGSPITIYSRRTGLSDCDVAFGNTGPPIPLRDQSTYLIYARLDGATQSYEINRAVLATSSAPDLAVIGPGTSAEPTPTQAPTAVAAVATPIAPTPTQASTATAVAATPAEPFEPPQYALGSPAPSGSRVAMPLLLVAGGVIAVGLLGIVSMRRIRQRARPGTDGTKR